MSNSKCKDTRLKPAYDSYFKELLKVESLFHWELIIEDENEHENDLEVVGDEFCFQNFIYHLINCYKKYKKENYKKALEIINTLEKSVSIFEKNSKPGSLFISINSVLKYIIHISKLMILLHNKSEECSEFIDAERTLDKLNEKEEAAVLAIRSACCAMYSYKGTENAMDFINRAIRKDPETSFWHFLKASYLYKLRTISNPTDRPSLDERDLLEKVHKEETNNPIYMVYLADVYRESANFNKNRKELNFWFVPEEPRKYIKEDTEKMYSDSKALYEKAYKLRPECPVVAFRCANGLMRLQQRYQNINLAKEIINNLIPKYKNSGYGNYVCAHPNFGKKSNSTNQYLKEAMKLNVFNAHINFVQLKYLENPKHDVVNDLKEMLDKFREAPKRKRIFSQLISYYLLIDQNLQLACDNMLKYMKEGGPKNSLERHKSCFLKTEEPVSLIDVLADEVKHTLRNQNLPQDSRTFFDKFVQAMNFYNVPILKGKPQNLKRQILSGHIPPTSTRCSRQQNPQRNQNSINKSSKFDAKQRKYPNNNLKSNTQMETASKNYGNNKPTPLQTQKQTGNTKTDGGELEFSPLDRVVHNSEQKNRREHAKENIRSPVGSNDEYCSDEYRSRRRLSSRDRYSRRHSSRDRYHKRHSSRDRYRRRKSSSVQSDSDYDSYAHKRTHRRGQSPKYRSKRREHSSRSSRTSDDYEKHSRSRKGYDRRERSPEYRSRRKRDPSISSRTSDDYERHSRSKKGYNRQERSPEYRSRRKRDPSISSQSSNDYERNSRYKKEYHWRKRSPESCSSGDRYRKEDRQRKKSLEPHDRHYRSRSNKKHYHKSHDEDSSKANRRSRRRSVSSYSNSSESDKAKKLRSRKTDKCDEKLIKEMDAMKLEETNSQVEKNNRGKNNK